MLMHNFEEASKTLRKTKGTLREIMQLQLEVNMRTTSLPDLYERSTQIKLYKREDIKLLAALQAIICAKSGSMDKARECLHTIYKETINEQIIFQVINRARNEGRFKDAIDFFNAVKQRLPKIEDPQDITGVYNLFVINEENNNTESATTYLSKLKAFPDTGPDVRSIKNMAFLHRCFTEVTKENFEAAKNVLKGTEFESSRYNRLPA